MFTIKTKIIIAITFVMGLVLCVFSIFVYKQVKSANLEKIDIRLENLAQKIRDEVDEQFENHEFPIMARLQNIGNEILPLSVFRLCDSSGTTVYTDSVLLKTPLRSVQDIQEKKPLIEKIRLDHKRYRALWRQVNIEGHPRCILQVAAPVSGLDENLDQLEFVLWTSIPLALLFTLCAVYVIVRRAFKPLSTMIETANRISASNLNERLPATQTHDEVAVLGNALNRMMERIEAAFTSQKQFIADASHEIRTPLTIVQSELEYADRSTLTDSAKQSIRIALDELEHLRKLAGDLLLLAKLEMPGQNHRFQSIRLDELIADCVKKLTRMSDGKNITLEVHIENAVEVTADEEKLRSALLNLIENALKYTPALGTVSLSLESDHEFIRIRIRDSGVGISPDDIQNIFEPFYRSDTSRATQSGSGLGLSIVQRVIELHHGTISVESTLNHGTTFHIAIPLKRTEEAP